MSSSSTMSTSFTKPSEAFFVFLGFMFLPVSGSFSNQCLLCLFDTSHSVSDVALFVQVLWLHSTLIALSFFGGNLFFSQFIMASLYESATEKHNLLIVAHVERGTQMLDQPASAPPHVPDGTRLKQYDQTRLKSIHSMLAA